MHSCSFVLTHAADHHFRLVAGRSTRAAARRNEGMKECKQAWRQGCPCVCVALFACCAAVHLFIDCRAGVPLINSRGTTVQTTKIQHRLFFLDSMSRFSRDSLNQSAAGSALRHRSPPKPPTYRAHSGHRQCPPLALAKRGATGRRGSGHANPTAPIDTNFPVS